MCIFIISVYYFYGICIVRWAYFLVNMFFLIIYPATLLKGHYYNERVQFCFMGPENIIRTKNTLVYGFYFKSTLHHITNHSHHVKWWHYCLLNWKSQAIWWIVNDWVFNSWCPLWFSTEWQRDLKRLTRFIKNPWGVACHFLINTMDKCF